MHEYTTQTLLIDHKRFMLHELCRGSTTTAGSDIYSGVPTIGDLGIEETLANLFNRSLVLRSCTRLNPLLIYRCTGGLFFMVSFLENSRVDVDF